MNNMAESVKNSRVLLVDDHSVVRAGFRMLLDEQTEFEVAEAESGEEACEWIRNNDADVVVMDIAMPGMGGLEAMRRILVHKPETHILVLSMFEDDVFPMRALSAGASGFISKRVAPDVLIDAINTVLRGEKYLTPETATRLASKRFSKADDPISELSEREFEIGFRLSEGESVSEIAEVLNLSVKTVSNHRLNILRKLSAKNAVELAHLFMSHGIANKKPAD